MYKVVRTGKFDRDVKLCAKRHYDMEELVDAIEFLRETGTLPVITPQKYRPHKLKGNYVHHWEAHINPDWLIIWLTDETKKIVTLVRTGTHSDLFKK